MRRPTLRRTLAAVTLVVLAPIAGCGSDDAPAADPASTGASSDVAPGDGGSGDGGAEGDTEDSSDVALPDDTCSLLTAAEVSTAVGATVTLTTAPGGDCAFSEEDPRGLSGLIGVVRDAAANGGYDAYLSGLAGVLDSPQVRDLDGLGDAAAVYVGVPGFGGSTQLMAGGVVDRGAFLEQTTISQASDLPADRLDPIAEALLRLLDAKLG